MTQRRRKKSKPKNLDSSFIIESNIQSQSTSEEEANWTDTETESEETIEEILSSESSLSVVEIKPRKKRANNPQKNMLKKLSGS